MIVPMSILHKHGEKPDFEAMVRSGKFKIDHTSFPAFMFDVESYSPRKTTASLLRGHYPIRILNAICNSPTAATGEKTRSTRRSNTQILGVRAVTPEMIAYACVHARFSISKQMTWGEVDGLFNMKKFYYAVLKLFRNKDAKWVRETLEWWTMEIFGDQDDPDVLEDDEEDPEDETSITNILAEIEAGDTDQPLSEQDESLSDDEDRRMILGPDKPEVEREEDEVQDLAGQLAMDNDLSQTQEDSQTGTDGLSL
ncbi:hypothetical protein ACEPAI_1663 [Sanghuangporus weigelae]